MKTITFFLTFLAFTFFLIGAVLAVDSEIRAAEEINWQVISSGGDEASADNLFLNGTIGQTAVGHSSSETNNLYHGFWQHLCMPGEADGLSDINILDIVYIINYKYKEGPAPVPYELCSGDAFCEDCIVNILDVVYLINYKYKESLPPCTCDEWVASCGPLQ